MHSTIPHELRSSSLTVKPKVIHVLPNENGKSELLSIFIDKESVDSSPGTSLRNGQSHEITSVAAHFTPSFARGPIHWASTIWTRCMRWLRGGERSNWKTLIIPYFQQKRCEAIHCHFGSDCQWRLSRASSLRGVSTLQLHSAWMQCEYCPRRRPVAMPENLQRIIKTFVQAFKF